MIPHRGPFRGQAYKLYEHYNEFHIFVEDSCFENLYKTLFKNHGLRIENVFSKNGKKSVIDAAKSCSDSKCVYIVDRDWDDLIGNLPNLKNVVMLDMHSVENYLLDYEAFGGIVTSCFPRSSLSELLSPEHFEEIVKQTSNALRPLFECYVTMMICGMDKKGASHHPSKFQQKNVHCAPDSSAIEKFVASVGAHPPEHVKNYFSEESLLEKGHGKYMLHFVWNGVTSRTRAKVNGIDNLMIRLAQLLSTANCQKLVDKIVCAANAQNTSKPKNPTVAKI